MQIVIILEARLAGQAGWLSRRLASWPAAQKDPLFIKKGGKRCTRMQNVLISEVPPAAAGRGGPEMIFFCTNDSFLSVQEK